MYLVKMQTALKNRIHNLLGRNRQKPPAVSDIFGAWGRAWMKEVDLPELDAKLMTADLAMLDSLKSQIKESEKWIAIRVSPYFGAFFKRLKARRGTNKSLVAVARKLCEASFYCLETRTHYRERVYRFRGTL